MIVRPGYDCIRNPCGKNGCGENPGAGHGIHCDEWVYVLRSQNEDCALSLLVFSGVWPATVPTASLGTMSFPRGADISLHCSFSPGIDGDEESRACEWVHGGRCWVHESSGLAAMEFMDDFFVKEDGKDQQDPFWRGMEDILELWMPPAKRRLN